MGRAPLTRRLTNMGRMDHMKEMVVLRPSTSTVHVSSSHIHHFMPTTVWKSSVAYSTVQYAQSATDTRVA